MATFKFYASESGSPKTGLVLAFESLNEVDSGDAVATGGASFAELAGGWYKMTGLNPDEDWVGVIDLDSDAAAGLPNDERFLPISMSPDDFIYEPKATPVFNEDSDSLKFLAFLEKNGAIVTADLTNCVITFFDDAHTQLFQETQASETNGVFIVTKSTPGLTANKGYYFTVAITQDGVTYTGTSGIVTIQ